MNIRKYFSLIVVVMLCIQPIIQPAASLGPVASTVVYNFLVAMSSVAVQQTLVRNDVCNFRGDFFVTPMIQRVSQSTMQSQQQMSTVLPGHMQQSLQEGFRNYSRSQLEFYTAKSAENVFKTHKAEDLMLSSVTAKPSTTHAEEITVVTTLQPKSSPRTSQERQVLPTFSLEFQVDKEGWSKIQERIAIAAYEQMQLRPGEHGFFARISVVQQSEPYYAHVQKTEAQLHAEQMAIVLEAFKQQEIYRFKQQQADTFLAVLDSFIDICGDKIPEVQCQEAVLNLIARCNGIQHKHIQRYLQPLQKQLSAEFFDKKTGEWLGFSGTGRARYIVFGHLKPMLEDKHVIEFLTSVQRGKQGSYQEVVRRLRKAMYFTDTQLAQANGYQSAFSIDLQKVAQNPVNQQMIRMINLFKAGNIKQAEKLIYINSVEHKALKQLFYKLNTHKNEFGIYQKYERDTVWINCPDEYKKQIQHAASLQLTVNEMLAQRAQAKKDLEAQFSIPYHHAAPIDTFLYKLVSYAEDAYAQTDFLVQAAQEHKEVAKLFCLPNGIFKKFKSSTWAKQFTLNKELPSFIQVKVLAGANNILSLPAESLNSAAGQRALQYIKHAAATHSAEEAAVYTVLADALQAHLGRGVALPAALHDVDFTHHIGREQHIQEFKQAHEHAVKLSQSIYTATMPNGLFQQFSSEGGANRFKYSEGYSLAEHQEFAALLNNLFAHYQQEKQKSEHVQGKKNTVIQAINYALRAYEWPQERAYKIIAQGTLKALNGEPHLQFLEKQSNLLLHEHQLQAVQHQAEYAQAERLAEKIIQHEEQAAANKAFKDALLCDVSQENDPWPLCDSDAMIDDDYADRLPAGVLDEQADPFSCGSSPLINDPQLKDFHHGVDVPAADPDSMPTCNADQQAIKPLTDVEHAEVSQEQEAQEVASVTTQPEITGDDVRVQPAVLPGTQELLTEEDVLKIWENADLYELEKIIELLNCDLEIKKVHSEEALKLEGLLQQALSLSERLEEAFNWKYHDLYYEVLESAYLFIRDSNNNISEIALNLKIDEKFILKIKQHVFIDEHLLDDGMKRFAPDIEILKTWIRLLNGNYNRADLMWLLHEYAEYLILQEKSFPYSVAHNFTNKKYNWAETLKD